MIQSVEGLSERNVLNGLDGLGQSKTFTLSSAATATNRVDSCHQRHLGLYPRKASPGEAVG